LEETLKSSTTAIEKRRRENLTHSDWMRVYAYVDNLSQPIKQSEVVNYFATRPEDPLFFHQSTLSRRLKHRSEIEARVESNPKYVIKQTSTHLHKTRCGTRIVGVGSANDAEGRGCQYQGAH